MKLSKTEILDLISEYYHFTRKREFADFLEISPATLTNWYSRNTFDYDIIINKCTDIDLNKLFNEDIAIPYNQSNPDRENSDATKGPGELLSLLKEKDRQLLEMSEKIGQLKEQIRQAQKR